MSFYSNPLPADRRFLTVTSTGFARPADPHRRVVRDGWRYYQLMWTASGEGAGVANGQEFIAKPSSLTLMPKHHLHEYGCRSAEEPWAYRWIEFDGDGADALVRMLGLGRQWSVPECTEAEPLVDEIVGLLESRGNSALHEATAILTRVLVVMESMRRKLSVETSSALRIERAVRRYFSEHLEEPIGMQDVAGSLSMSPHHVIREFKRVNGVTPFRYLRDLRMNRAKALLHDDRLNISEIGQSVGYPNLAHFSRIFHQATGLSPKAFRERVASRSE